MKIALCNEVVAPGLSFRDQCRLASSLGYDGLEVAPFTLGESPHQLTHTEIRKARESALQEGIEITGLHWLLVSPRGLSLTSPSAAVRRETEEVMHRMVDMCALLGGRVLVHGSPKQRMIEATERREEAFERAVKIFKSVAENARRQGLLYCIEPLTTEETNFVNTLQEASALVRAVGNPAFKTMFDARSARTMESVEPDILLQRWLSTDLIAHVHLNDTNLRAPGQGSDAFVDILRVLRDADYDGVITIEPFVYEPDGPTCAARAIGFVRGVIAALESPA